MKYYLFITAVWIVTALAVIATHAQDQTIFRDAQGRIIGTATTSNGTKIYRDAQGKTTGTATINNGTTIYRDAQGRTTGTARK
jgi:YD repeat-containing protein